MREPSTHLVIHSSRSALLPKGVCRATNASASFNSDGSWRPNATSRLRSGQSRWIVEDNWCPWSENDEIIEWILNMVEYMIYGSKHSRIAYAKESGHLFYPHFGLIPASMKGNLKYTIVKKKYQDFPNGHFSCQTPWFSHVTILSFFAKNVPYNIPMLAIYCKLHRRVAICIRQIQLTDLAILSAKARKICVFFTSILPLEEKKSMAALRFHPSSARWTWPIRMSPVSPGDSWCQP